MTIYTIELTHRVPNYVHVAVDAETVEEAVAKAVKYDGDAWRLDWEAASQDEITGVWTGPRAYSGDVVPIPKDEPFEPTTPAPSPVTGWMLGVFGGAAGGFALALAFMH